MKLTTILVNSLPISIFVIICGIGILLSQMYKYSSKINKSAKRETI